MIIFHYVELCLELRSIRRRLLFVLPVGELSSTCPFARFGRGAGWCIGFAFSPPHRMAPIVQLLATAAVCAVGTALTLPELPAAKLDDEEDYEQLTEEQGQPSASR